VNATPEPFRRHKKLIDVQRNKLKLVQRNKVKLALRRDRSIQYG